MAETYRAPGTNQAPTPASMPQTNPLAGMSDTARGLYVDPTPAFQPSLDFIGGQRTQANERYAQNKADIANIFGNLTQVNRESQTRVNEQFTKSIADQQMQTAERVAQARLGQQQTQEAAIRAMDERGGGPMGNLLASPVAVEAERGIGDMNAYQQIWAGQQGAIRGQTEQDLMAAQRGLGYQEVQANQGLQRSLEDVLMGLSGQEAGIRGDLAGAIIGQQSRVREANYNEIMERQAAEAAARIASIRASNQPASYSSGTQGVLERIAAEAGPDSSMAFSQSIADVLGGSGGVRRAPGSVSEAMQRWIQANPEMAAAYQGYANQMFADVLSKAIPAGSRGNFVDSRPGQRNALQDLFGNFGQQ